MASCTDINCMFAGTTHYLMFIMIRNRTDEDIERIVRIWLEASLLAHSFIPAMYWIDQADEMRFKYIPASQTWVYQDDETGEVTGFVSMVDDYLAALFVIPEKQGTGIGKALLNHVKAIHPTIKLAVYAKNTQAVGFYESQGFMETEERIDANTGEPELAMHFIA